MRCSHPVIYERNGALVCQICGSEVRPEPQVENHPPEPASGSEAPKRPAKRRVKKTDD